MHDYRTLLPTVTPECRILSDCDQRGNCALGALTVSDARVRLIEGTNSRRRLRSSSTEGAVPGSQSVPLGPSPSRFISGLRREWCHTSDPETKACINIVLNGWHSKGAELLDRMRELRLFPPDPQSANIDYNIPCGKAVLTTSASPIPSITTEIAAPVYPPADHLAWLESRCIMRKVAIPLDVAANYILQGYYVLRMSLIYEICDED